MFRALKKPKLEENSSEQILAILSLNRLPEPSPVKRRPGNFDSPSPQCQLRNFDPSNEIGTPPRAPPVSGGLSSPKPHSAKAKAKHDEVPRQVARPIASFSADRFIDPAIAARHNVLDYNHFLYASTFFAAACLITIALTLPRYTPPTTIKRTPERRLSRH